VFVRDIDRALQRAEASYSRETRDALIASERSIAFYHELHALDAQSIRDGNYVPLPPLRRGMLEVCSALCPAAHGMSVDSGKRLALRLVVRVVS
jgi:hypothetical protein